jgi:replication factor C subunit 3/5
MDKLWVDKYRPKSLDRMDYHADLAKNLGKIASAEDFPHLLVYGPSGAGKKTRVMAFLAEVFGASVYKLSPMSWEFKTSASSSNTVELSILSSNFHLDLNPSDVDQYDRIVLQKLIKEVASSQQINQKVQRPFKVIIINDADRLTREAQAALRRTMEKYVAKCRLILVAENIGRVIAPLRSRCLLVRVPAPSRTEMSKILREIGNREGVKMNDQMLDSVVKDSERNLRRAVILLQSIKMQQLMGRNVEMRPPEWRQAIANIARQILQEQSPKILREIRDRFYELLVNCIPADLIFKYLMKELLTLTDVELQFDIIHWTAFHETRMEQGTKPIFHLEAFAAKVMVIFKKYIVELNAM